MAFNGASRLYTVRLEATISLSNLQSNEMIMLPDFSLIPNTRLLWWGLTASRSVAVLLYPVLHTMRLRRPTLEDVLVVPRILSRCVHLPLRTVETCHFSVLRAAATVFALRICVHMLLERERGFSSAQQV
ncbi:hypothetical protein Tco_0726249 [Tanacetum coccineum]|uniref:Uncharacterized protein n=1 Tax=Tanacetum coccineum TaxID=301880 RepID=A0ABQ4YHD4_9ASTR